jgi:hypothetical protein
MKGDYIDFIKKKSKSKITFEDVICKGFKFIDDDGEETTDPYIQTIYYYDDNQIYFFTNYSIIYDEIINAAKNQFNEFKIFENGEDGDLTTKILIDQDQGGCWIEIYGISDEIAIEFLKSIYEPLVNLKGWKIDN